MRNLSIAIDGPAGAGKSSMAKALANKLDYLYIDTGAMYRAVTFGALEKNIVDDKEAIIAMLPDLSLKMKPANGTFKISIWDRDITDEIRSQLVNNNVSKVAAIKEVRAYLVEKQREMAKEGRIIIDGRDIGSVVLPNADIKFYLTATVQTRAKRRWLELEAAGEKVDIKEIEASVAQRDHLDSTREESPLICVEDAVVIDSSELTFDETVEKMQSIIEEMK